ncbi:MAG: cupin domain-containing protein [Legionellales bacterium]|nr:cupin domain-containing protein [Legionellales bacterium]
MMVSAQELQFQWHQRGYSFSLWHDPPGQVWHDFVHPTDEVFMLLTGEITLTIHGQTLYPKPGEEIKIPANTPHTIRNIGLTENCWCFGYKH